MMKIDKEYLKEIIEENDLGTCGACESQAPYEWLFDFGDEHFCPTCNSNRLHEVIGAYKKAAHAIALKSPKVNVEKEINKQLAQLNGVSLKEYEKFLDEQ